MNLSLDPGSETAGGVAVATAVSMSDVPKEAWMILAQNASEIVKDFLSPLTSTTSGLGRLITEKFNGKVEVEKVLCADTLQRTQAKLIKAGKPLRDSFDPAVVIPVLDECGRQSVEEMREMWASILSEELTEGRVHPELVRALSRLTHSEASKLKEINSEEYQLAAISRRELNADEPQFQFNFNLSDRLSAGRLRNHILVITGLAEEDKWGWLELTILGKRLLEIVDPKETMHTAEAPVDISNEAD
jgi:hypothetical protein